jgi:leucyl/phenylalanyl-tRNA--protein transferase
MSGSIEHYTFPPLEAATPEGLLAVGGDLSSGRLLSAYRQGIFPWYSAGQPILWWSPDPRTVLCPDALKISRSLKKTLRHRGYCVTSDQHFTGVIQACAKPRDEKEDSGTWITPEMIKAYTTLNESGYAHSLEVWDQQTLIGGLYGVAIGRIFFGESMFSHSTDASKIALAALVRIISDKKFQLIDCQVPSEHLFSLGAKNVPRNIFSGQLQTALAVGSQPETWNYNFDSSDLL